MVIADAFISSYRYGFQGQEKDDEIAGNGNSYTAEYWQYNSRLGRRWNMDPIVKEHESPYACFANNPLWLIDPNGADTSFSSTQAANDFNTIYNNLSNRINDISNELEGYREAAESFKTLNENVLSPEILNKPLWTESTIVFFTTESLFITL